MLSVADNLAENIAEAECRAHNTRLPMVESGHPIISVCDAARAVGKGHGRLLIGRRGMSQRRNDSLLTQEPGQAEVPVMFAGDRHDPDQSLRSLQISFELFQIRLHTEPLRLGSLIGLVQIGSLEVDSQDLSPLIPFADYFRDIAERLGQDFLRLCDRCRQKSGDTLAHYIFSPVAEPLFLCVIGVKPVSPVRVDIDEARKDPPLSEVQIRIFRSAGQNPDYFSGFLTDLYLRLQPGVQHPDPSALYNHLSFTSAFCRASSASTDSISICFQRSSFSPLPLLRRRIAAMTAA